MKNWMSSRRFRRRLTAAVIVIVTVWFGGPFSLRVAGQWLDVGGPLATPMQYGYILGGGADVRPVTAAGLYRAGLIQEILIPNPPEESLNRCKPLSDVEIVRSVLEQEGVPESAIGVLDGQPSSTEEEMAMLAQFLQVHAATDIALVTHDYHTRRSVRLLRMELKLRGLENRCRISVVSTPTDGYSARNWWCTEDGLLHYGLEYAKTLRDFLRR